ncbi:MAG: VCBS repeat-containing protein, partial [Pirellulaceae bacterium]
MNRFYLLTLLPGLIGLLLPLASVQAQSRSWTRHVVYEGEHCNTAVAGDFTGDGQVDVICNAGGETLLLVAPGWEQIPIGQETGLNLIHGEVMDVDRDGRLDFIGCRYKPGYIVWMRQPEEATRQRWVVGLVDDKVDGIHGLLVGDVDGDRWPDLLANSAQPTGPFANSLVWYRQAGRRGQV